ncbi:TetR/AcrR family transcriptional regulator [Nocardioides sp. GXZ039]|uniref:TetR/AcrR family transcriptional regulator n=1 Tax=Nocardioides sp. GXZ039 TaxID=3136018 RepID=UPI0030F4A7B8
MPRPVDPLRREQVLEGAIIFLAEHGLAGLSLRRLAAHLGVSTNVISYQFGSKEGLVDAALARARSASTEMLMATRTEDPDVTVADAVRRTWAWWRAAPERFAYPRLNVEAMMTSDASAFEQGRRPELVNFWIDFFIDWFVSEGRSRAHAEELSTLLSATLSGLMIDTLCTGSIDRVDRSLERLALMIEP